MNQIIDIVSVEGATLVIDVETPPLVVAVDVYVGGDTAGLQAQITALEARVSALEAGAPGGSSGVRSYFFISGQY